jgi:hypothetical protein
MRLPLGIVVVEVVVVAKALMEWISGWSLGAVFDVGVLVRKTPFQLLFELDLGTASDLDGK